MCQFFCVNGLGFVFGMGLQGKVPLPLPIRVEARRCHDAALSMPGIRSGQRMLKWLSASRQLRIGMVQSVAHTHELIPLWIMVTTYTDSSVVSGQSYYYVTTAVGSAGSESAHCAQVQAVIPNP